MTTKISFVCPKCQHTEYERDEIRATGKFSRFLNIQHKSFRTVSCTACGYTELYKGESSKLASVFDFFSG